MDSVCGRKQAGKVEGNSCLSADAAEALLFPVPNLDLMNYKCHVKKTNASV